MKSRRVPQILCALWLALMLAACAAQQHAVRCSGPLQPINMAPAGHPLHRAVP